MSESFPVKTIGIVGGGVVGKATARCFMEFTEVRVYDVMPERRTHNLREVLYSDLIFVCLPTPKNKDGMGLDVSALDNFFSFRLGDADDEHWACQRNFVLKSTVPIGTTRRLAKDHILKNLVHSPEFLTARTAAVDAMTPSRNIIGGPNRTQQSQCELLLNRVYLERFPGVDIHCVPSDESELIKLAQNSFFATKISFFNELHAYVTAKGLDWNNVLEGILSDGRIAHSHTQVPGPDGLRGYGGHCLPKDISGTISCFLEAGCRADIMTAVVERNKHDREQKSG